jgi:hypothetical protein
VVDSSLNSTNITVADMKPVLVKTGISDGIYIEVLDGLKEGDAVVTGQTITGGGAAGAAAATNPFASGGGGGFGGGRGPR